jgi:hypothetical protein
MLIIPLLSGKYITESKVTDNTSMFGFVNKRPVDVVGKDPGVGGFRLLLSRALPNGRPLSYTGEATMAVKVYR